MSSCFFSPAVKAFSPEGCSKLINPDNYKTGSDRLTLTANILAGIGAAALLVAAVVGFLVVAGVTLAFLAGLSFPVLVTALAVSAVAFGLCLMRLPAQT